MPQLSRHTKSSLHSQFNDAKPVKQASEESEDVERDPSSSEDELSNEKDTGFVLAKDRIAAAAATDEATKKSAQAKAPPTRGRWTDPLVRNPARQTSKPQAKSSSYTTKRKRNDPIDGEDEDDDSLFRDVRDVTASAPDKKDELSIELEFGSSQLGPRSSQSKRQYGSQSKRSYATSSPKKAKTAPEKDKPIFKKPPSFADAVERRAESSFRLPPDTSTKPVKKESNFRQPPRPGNEPLREGSANASFVRLRTPDPSIAISSPLSTPPASSVYDMNDPISSISSPISPSSPTDSSTIPCPICRTSVDRSIYNDFLSTSTRNRLTTRDKLRFCETHNAATAQEKFRTSDYPTIDWAALPRRLEKMNSTVKALLTQEVHSTYRADLQSAIGSGKTNFRHALRNPEAMPAAATAGVLKSSTNDDIITIPSSSAPLPSGGSVTTTSSQNSSTSQTQPKKTVAFGIAGYYGARGAKMIMDHVIQSATLSQKLREVSTTEKIYKALGVSGFVQAVIVPEIAWRLVREDMKLGGTRKGGRRKGGDGLDGAEEEGEKRAKEILVESWEVGELINHEEESEVVVADDEEEEDEDGERTVVDLDEDDYY